MARVTKWWASQWPRWFGWTLVFALVTGACALAYGASTGCKRWPKGSRLVADACALAYRTLEPGISQVGPLAFLVPPLVAAFLIGVRFPSRWWPAGPPLAVFVAGTPLLLIPNEVAAPHIPESLFHDMTYGEAMGVALLFLLLGMTILLVLYALAAYAGVKWGQRREAANVSSTGLSLDGDPAP